MSEEIDKLLPFERDLFLALNGSDSTFWDNVMWTITGRWIWLPVILFLIYVLFFKTSWKQGLLIFLGLVLVGVLCDQASSALFKPLFQRYRPTHHPDYQYIVDIVNGYRGGSYGFISGHATNSFGIALFLTLVYRSRWLFASIFFWALVNSYSRIYLGVHFISDIVAGACVGMLIAVGIYQIYSFADKKFVRAWDDDQLPKIAVAKKRNARILAALIFAYLICILAFSPFLVALPH